MQESTRFVHVTSLKTRTYKTHSEKTAIAVELRHTNIMSPSFRARHGFKAEEGA